MFFQLLLDPVFQLNGVQLKKIQQLNLLRKYLELLPLGKVLMEHRFFFKKGYKESTRNLYAVIFSIYCAVSADLRK